MRKEKLLRLVKRMKKYKSEQLQQLREKSLELETAPEDDEEVIANDRLISATYYIKETHIQGIQSLFGVVRNYRISAPTSYR